MSEADVTPTTFGLHSPVYEPASPLLAGPYSPLTEDGSPEADWASRASVADDPMWRFDTIPAPFAPLPVLGSTIQSSDPTRTHCLLKAIFSAYPIRKRIFRHLSAFDTARVLSAVSSPSSSSLIPPDIVGTQERNTYLNPLRDIFTYFELRQLQTLIDLGCAITLIGKDLRSLFHRVRHPEAQLPDRRLNLWVIIQDNPAWAPSLPTDGSAAPTLIPGEWKHRGDDDEGLELSPKINTPELSVSCYWAFDRESSTRLCTSSLGFASLVVEETANTDTNDEAPIAVHLPFMVLESTQVDVLNMEDPKFQTSWKTETDDPEREEESKNFEICFLDYFDCEVHPHLNFMVPYWWKADDGPVNLKGKCVGWADGDE